VLGVGLVLALVIPGWLVADAGRSVDGVWLPESIAAYAQFTDAAESDPAGTALLLYSSGNWEVFDTYQDLALGVDGRSYRQIASARVKTAAGASRHTFLAPDGASVLISDPASDGRPLTTVDLRTGATRDIPIAAGAGVMALAWSPDLRTVALAVAGPGPDPNLSYIRAGTLTLLDLRTGTLTPLPGLGDSRARGAGDRGERRLPCNRDDASRRGGCHRVPAPRAPDPHRARAPAVCRVVSGRPVDRYGFVHQPGLPGGMAEP
jgi:hypothetical protein